MEPGGTPKAANWKRTNTIKTSQNYSSLTRSRKAAFQGKNYPSRPDNAYNDGMSKRLKRLKKRWAPVLALIGALVAVASPAAWGRPDSQKPNAREACRQSIAGAYLKTYDERERIKMYIRSLDEQVAALDDAFAKAKVEQRALAKTASASTFDVNIAVRQDELQTTTNTLEARAKEARDQRRDAGTDLDQHVHAEQVMRKSIERVFKFTRVEDKPDGGYPTDMRYKSDCPPFRILCPLPAKDVDNLLKILVEGAPVEDCKRYAGLSRLR